MAFNSLMHDRNIYKNRPDFEKIAKEFPEFRKHALADSKGKVRVDFNNPDALRMLTKILLKKDFNLSIEIPKGFLIPTIPQRLNYILWVEDLLTILPSINKIPFGIDIGCGPCAIFSLLGAKKNGWKFVSTESSEESLQWALNNINTNNLNAQIKVVKSNSDGILNELLSSDEDIYDFCLCNPPFFDNIEEIRKKNTKAKETIAAIAKQEEIFAEGGEVAFVKKIIDESFIFKDRIRLYTSMFGKKKSFVEIWKTLQNEKDISVTKTQFCQGNTIRWGIAWTFQKSVCFDKLEKSSPKKPKKPKPPLVHPVPKNIEGVDYNVQELSKEIFKILKELEIVVKVVRSHEHYIESLITSDKNTWSHQRRKRREMGRNVNTTNPGPQILPNSSSAASDRDFQVETMSSLHLPQNKSEEDCDVKLKREAEKRKLAEPQFDSQKKFCSGLDSVKSGETNSFLKSNKEFETNSSKSKDCFDSSNISCKDLNLIHSRLKSHETLIESSNEKHESKVVKTEGNSNISGAELDLEFKNESKKRKLHEAQFDSNKKICSESVKLSETQLSLNNELSEKSSVVNLVLFSEDNESNNVKHATKSSDECSKSSVLSSILTDEQKQIIPDKQEREDISKNTTPPQLDIAQSGLNDKKMSDLCVSKNYDCKEQTASKKVSKKVAKKDVVLNSNENMTDIEFEAKSLLFCTLKIRKAKEFVLIEMNCPPESNRETMHQIFQYLKNKLQGSL